MNTQLNPLKLRQLAYWCSTIKQFPADQMSSHYTAFVQEVDNYSKEINSILNQRDAIAFYDIINIHKQQKRFPKKEKTRLDAILNTIIASIEPLIKKSQIDAEKALSEREYFKKS